MSDRVSVILYSYNYARYLKQAIESVLGQTYRDVELVISDNASTDESPGIIKSYAGDPRVKTMFHRENSLMGRRFNEPLSLATGRYVAFLYADDYFLPERLERHMDIFSRLPEDYGVVYGPCWRDNTITGERWVVHVVKESGAIFEKTLRQAHRDGLFQPPMMTVRRSCLTPYAYYPDDLFEGEAMYLRLAMSNKFQHHPEPLAVMREHLSNLGKALRWNCANFTSMVERLERFPEFPKSALPALNAYRSRHMLVYGWQGVRVLEDGAWARACLRRAVLWRPWRALHPKALATLALSFLPASALRAFNRIMGSFRKHRENLAAVEPAGNSRKS